MSDIISDYIASTAPAKRAGDYYHHVAPRMVMADGFSVSVQATSAAYCCPRENDGPWTHFELGFPSAPDPLLTQYAEQPETPTETVYGYVPGDVVESLIASHGGIKR